MVNDRWGKDTRHKHGGYWTTEYTPGMADMAHPWEENRGMGFSYGFNRAERIEHYHSGRELVIMLIDLVSRGGNLLLDIGPNGDGTIPVVMEDRLLQIGSWPQGQRRRYLRNQSPGNPPANGAPANSRRSTTTRNSRPSMMSRS